MESGSNNPSADEIFSVLETEFTRVTRNTPPPSPGATRCLYSFRVDVLIERIGSTYRLLSVRPVKNPGGPYSHTRGAHRPGPTPTSRTSGYGFSSYHPYDPPVRPQHSHPAGSTAPQRPTAPRSGTASGSPFATPSWWQPPPWWRPPSSPSPSHTTAGSSQKPTFDRESHRRFMEKLELLAEAEERWKAQKAREARASADSVRGSGGDKTSSVSR